MKVGDLVRRKNAPVYEQEMIVLQEVAPGYFEIAPKLDGRGGRYVREEDVEVLAESYNMQRPKPPEPERFSPEVEELLADLPTAREIRERLGWKPLSDEERAAQLDSNLDDIMGG